MPVQLLYTFDSAISHIIQATRTPQLTGIMLFFTWLGSTRAVAGLLLAGCLFTLLLKRQESRRQQLQAVIFLLAATAGSWLCSQWLKEMLHRARPAGGLVFAPGYSFPSGHATVAIAFYGALLFLLWPHLPGRLARYTTMLFAATLVLAIGISRIYLGVHYPSDVLGGYVTGSVWLAICVLGWYKAQNSLR